VSERTPQQAYLGLQKLARSQGRNTQQLFELYIHERFLAPEKPPSTIGRSRYMATRAK